MFYALTFYTQLYFGVYGYEKGTLSFRESEAPTICVQERFAQEKGEYTLPIEEGVVEQQENKIIVLAQ